MKNDLSYPKEVVEFIEKMYEIDDYINRKVLDKPFTNLQEKYVFECFLATFFFDSKFFQFYKYYNITLEEVCVINHIDLNIKNYSFSDNPSLKIKEKGNGYILYLEELESLLSWVDNSFTSMENLIHNILVSCVEQNSKINDTIHKINPHLNLERIFTETVDRHYGNLFNRELIPLLEPFNDKDEGIFYDVSRRIFNSKEFYDIKNKENVSFVYFGLLNILLNEINKDSELKSFVSDVFGDNSHDFHTTNPLNYDKYLSIKTMKQYFIKGQKVGNNLAKNNIYDIIKYFIQNGCDDVKKILISKGYPEDYFDHFDENFEKYKIKCIEEENKRINDAISEIKSNPKRAELFDYLLNHKKMKKFFYKNEPLLDVNSKELDFCGLVLSLYYSNNDLVSYLDDSTINFEYIFSCLYDEKGISKEKFSEFKDEEVDLEEIIKYISEYKNENIYDYLKFKCDFYNENICTDETNLDRMIVSSIVQILDKYSKDQKIAQFLNTPVSDLNINDVGEIATYGKELADLSIFISDEFSSFMKNGIDMHKVNDISTMINSMNVKQTFLQKIFKNNPYTKLDKEMLDNLKKFLDEEEIIMKQEIQKFGPLKMLLEAYILRAEKYIQNLKEKMLNDFSLDICAMDNGFNKQEYLLKKSLIESKLNDFLVSVNLMYQQYLKVCTTEALYTLNLNKVVNANMSLLPALYMELLFTNGAFEMSEINESLVFMKNLLGNMSQLSTEYITKNYKQLIVSNNLELEDNLKVGNLLLEDKEISSSKQKSLKKNTY